MNISPQTWTLHRYPVSCQVRIILILRRYLPELQEVSFQSFCGPFPPSQHLHPSQESLGGAWREHAMASAGFLRSQTGNSSPVGRLGLKLLSFLLLSCYGPGSLGQARSLCALPLPHTLCITSTVWEHTGALMPGSPFLPESRESSSLLTVSLLSAPRSP